MRAVAGSRILLILISCLVALAAQALEIPAQSGRVVDQAEMLDEASQQKLGAELAELERATGAQFAILTIPGLQGEALEDYSMRVAEQWQLGRKGVDDGVLLLVARDDRKMRIEVGYGLEGVLTDAASRRVIDNLIRPAFRAGDFAKGIGDAVDAISAALRGETEEIAPGPQAETGAPNGAWLATVFFGLMMLPFAWIAVAIRGGQGWMVYLFLAVFFYAVPLMWGQVIAYLSLAAWLVIGGLLRLWWPEKWKIESGAGTGTGSGHSGWSGGSGYSRGGGFSGGGGGFGGGGASGGW